MALRRIKFKRHGSNIRSNLFRSAWVSAILVFIASLFALAIPPALANYEDPGLDSGNAVIDRSTVPGETILRYQTVGTSTFTAPSGVDSVRVLVIGGGGGGGHSYGGGGGAGGYIHETAYSVTPGAPLTVEVGAGGVGGSGGNGISGGDSIFGTLTAVGGGYGSARGLGPGGNGGSGGGGGSSGPGGNWGNPTSGQGNRGGQGKEWTTNSASRDGGGGGGAGGAGGDAYNAGQKGGAGGVGLANDISGTSVLYASGGHGGAATFGYDSTVPGTNGLGEGGGGGSTASGNGDAGGSGIVIVRFITRGVEVIVDDNLTSESPVLPLDQGLIKFQLPREPTAPVTIALSSSDTTEGTVQASITIQPEDWDDPNANQVVITGVDDVLSDGAVEYNIITGDITSADPIYDSLDGPDVDDVVMFNQSDDPPDIALEIADNSSGEDGSTARVRFRLLAQPDGGANVTIPLSVSNTNEGSVAPSITILNANWDNPAANEVVITGVDDYLVDGNVLYQLVTGDPTSADPAYDGLDASQVADPSLTNYDNDAPAVTVTGDPITVTEGGSSEQVSVSIATQPASGNIVRIIADPQDDLDLGGGPGVAVDLDFDELNWNSAQLLNVTAVDDSFAEGNHNSKIELSIDTTATTEDSYDLVHIPSVIVHVIDNDLVAGQLTLLTPSATEGGEITARITIDIVNASGSPLEFHIEPIEDSAEDGIDYVDFTGQIVSIPPGASFADFTIYTIDDSLDEGDETIGIGALAPTGSAYSIVLTPPEVSATIIDNDGDSGLAATGQNALLYVALGVALIFVSLGVILISKKS